MALPRMGDINLQKKNSWNRDVMIVLNQKGGNSVRYAASQEDSSIEHLLPVCYYHILGYHWRQI